MKISPSDARILVGVVAEELADIDDRSLVWGEFQQDVLPDARRKLSYWIGRDISETDLYDAQDALLTGNDSLYEESVNRIVSI